MKIELIIIVFVFLIIEFIKLIIIEFIKLKKDYNKKVVILQAEKEAARTKKKKMRTLMNRILVAYIMFFSITFILIVVFVFGG